MSVTAKNASEQCVLDFFETLQSGDLEKLRAFLTDQSIWKPMVRDIPGAGEYHGQDIVDVFLAPVRGMFKPGDPKVIVNTIFSDGDMVAVESKGLGETSDGKIYDNDYAWIFKVKDRKIVHIHEYMDSHFVARLFGI